MPDFTIDRGGLPRGADEALSRILRSLLPLHIDGIEVTQAIQYYKSYKHLTDPADIKPDNSIPLIAGKPALVRVYVRSFPVGMKGVSGTLHLERHTFGFPREPTDLQP